MTLIMICGQGSSGKSTTAKLLQNILSSKATVISMDPIVGVCFDVNKKQEYNAIFIKNIQATLCCNEYEYVIVEYSLDSMIARAQLLQSLDLNNSIHFITLALRPGPDTIIQWDRKRKNRALSDQEKMRIQTVYKNFEPPSVEEFSYYNFSSVNCYSINNSTNVEEKLKQIFVL